MRLRNSTYDRRKQIWPWPASQAPPRGELVNVYQSEYFEEPRVAQLKPYSLEAAELRRPSFLPTWYRGIQSLSVSQLPTPTVRHFQDLVPHCDLGGHCHLDNRPHRGNSRLTFGLFASGYLYSLFLILDPRTETDAGPKSMEYNYAGHLSSSRRNILRPRYIYHHLRRDGYLLTDPAPSTIEYQARTKGGCRMSFSSGPIYDHLLDPAIDANPSSGLWRRKLDDAGALGHY